VRFKLVAAAFMLIAVDSALATCPGNTQTTIVFGNGILNTPDDAQFSLDSVLTPAVLQTLGTSVDPSCIEFALAYNSLFYNSDSQAVVDIENFFPQIADAFAQRGIDFAANFWKYWTLSAAPPAWFQNFQQLLILSATSVFQPDLLTQESFYNSEIGMGHNVIVVAHSQGNLYANQAYSVVTSLGGASLFHIVSVATPATNVAGMGPYFTLHGDIITLVPGSLAANITNDPPSPCPSAVSPLTLLNSTVCHSFDGSYMDVNNGDNTRPAIVNAVVAFFPVTWLSFLTGNPGIPGDGEFVSPGPTTYPALAALVPFPHYQLQPPIPLTALGNGFTLTVFPPSGTVSPTTAFAFNLYLLALDPPPGCPVIVSWLITGIPYGTTTYNGVQGFYFYYQLGSFIDFLVPSTGCEYGFDNQSFVAFDAFPVFGVQPLQLDAAAIGLGFGNVPR
jgi:hypothetical protein